MTLTECDAAGRCLELSWAVTHAEQELELWCRCPASCTGTQYRWPDNPSARPHRTGSADLVDRHLKSQVSVGTSRSNTISTPLFESVISFRTPATCVPVKSLVE